MTGSGAVHGPDFLVIGAHRAGTTWLHRVLRKHPSLWLPPVKELHYFDQLGLTRTWQDKKRWRRALIAGARTMDPWILRYLLGQRNDVWYASLFQRARSAGYIVGEVTPAYATLETDVLRRIHRLNPSIKLIFIMREPVSRAWSAVNNGVRKGYASGNLTLSNALHRAHSKSFLARSAYTETIARLESVFPKSQLHFCFFDYLKKEPGPFAARILAFLGVDSSNTDALLPPGAVNSAAGSKPVPPEFQYAIAQESLPMVEALCHRFDGPPHNWLATYRKLL